MDIEATFTCIRLHCESVLIRVRLMFTFTLSHLNEYPKRTDLKTPTKVSTFGNTVFLQVCKWVKRHPLECAHKVKCTHINVDQKRSATVIQVTSKHVYVHVHVVNYHCVSSWASPNQDSCFVPV